MGKRFRNKQDCKPLNKLGLQLPEELDKYLSKKQRILLKCILANYTIQDIAVYTKFSRSIIMNELVDLGRVLATYQLVECQIFPENISSTDYLKGWIDCKKFIRRLIHDKLKWRKTIKDGNSGAERKD